MHPITATPPPPHAPARCQLSPEDGANRLHPHLKQTVHCFIICEGPCVILVDLARALWVDVFWPRPGTPAALRCSVGWSISWLMTQQMFVGPGRWNGSRSHGPPCQERTRADGKTRTRLSSIITKSYPGKQFQRAPSVLTAFGTTSPSPSYVITLHSLNIWSGCRRRRHQITLRIYEAIRDDDFII